MLISYCFLLSSETRTLVSRESTRVDCLPGFHVPYIAGSGLSMMGGSQTSLLLVFFCLSAFCTSSQDLGWVIKALRLDWPPD